MSLESMYVAGTYVCKYKKDDMADRIVMIEMDGRYKKGKAKEGKQTRQDI